MQEEPIGKSWQLCFLLQQFSCYNLPVGVPVEDTVPASGTMAPCRGCCCEVGRRGAGRILGEPSLGSCQPLVSTADLETAARRLPSRAAYAQWLTLPMGSVCCHPWQEGLEGPLIHPSPDFTCDRESRI